MFKTAIIYGSLSGIIMGAMFFIMHPADGQMDFEASETAGYITMIISLTSIFLAINKVKKSKSHEHFTFSKAFLTGAMVTLVASVFYVSAWELYSNTIGGNFADQYLAYTIEQLQQQDKDAAVIEDEIAATTASIESYKANTLYRIGFSFLEIVPIGLLVSLVASIVFRFLLRKSNVG